MSQREPILMVATGQKKVGKTYTTTQLIEQYIRSNPTTGKKARKVLIYDVNMEYTQFKAIALKDVKRYTLQQRVEVIYSLGFASNMSLIEVYGDVKIWKVA